MVETSEYTSSSKRENLLDVVLTSMQGKAAIISRLIIVVKHSRREQGYDGVRALLQKAIEKSDQPANEISGLLLVWPLCSACMLEARTSSLLAILRELSPCVVSHSSVSQSELQFLEARIVSSTEDIPSRCYSGLFSTFINSPSTTDTMDACDSTSIVKVASDLNLFLRKVGQSLQQGQTEAEVKRRLMSLESHFDNVPAPETILSLTPAEDAPTLDEYLSIFDAPVNVDLESEAVFPAPTPGLA